MTTCAAPPVLLRVVPGTDFRRARAADLAGERVLDNARLVHSLHRVMRACAADFPKGGGTPYARGSRPSRRSEFPSRAGARPVMPSRVSVTVEKPPSPRRQTGSSDASWTAHGGKSLPYATPVRPGCRRALVRSSSRGVEPTLPFHTVESPPWRLQTVGRIPTRRADASVRHRRTVRRVAVRWRRGCRRAMSDIHGHELLPAALVERPEDGRARSGLDDPRLGRPLRAVDDGELAEEAGRRERPLMHAVDVEPRRAAAIELHRRSAGLSGIPSIPRGPCLAQFFLPNANAAARATLPAVMT